MLHIYLYTAIVAANSSSTLITTFTLGATDTASSPVELVHNVPPAAYNTTSASTLVSAGYFLYLGGTRLEIFNNSADILQPLHSFLLSDCEGPRRLAQSRARNIRQQLGSYSGSNCSSRVQDQCLCTVS